jgi:Rrf2 family transcriptional regulator, nitric oxide-sensitive transcriptional repressor
MRLTSFTDYGLRALMRLAGEPDRIFTTDEIANEFAISGNHLTKVVRELAYAGFITTHRGAGGGFRLAKSADAISLGDVVRCLEARQALVECFRADGGDCVLTPRCRLKSRLAAARTAFFAELEKSSLAECAYPVARALRRPTSAPVRKRAAPKPASARTQTTATE